MSLGDENFLKLVVLTVAQLCENTRNHFKSVNCMVCELHLMKLLKKMQPEMGGREAELEDFVKHLITIFVHSVTLWYLCF